MTVVYVVIGIAVLLVVATIGYAAHERGLFEAVSQARAAANQRLRSPAGPQARARAEGTLGQALGRLFAVVENHPRFSHLTGASSAGTRPGMDSGTPRGATP